jgi:hypothetical protein
MKVANQPRLRKMVPAFFMLPLLIITYGSARMPVNAGAPVVSLLTTQNPTEAESYRKLAAAKRKAAVNVPGKRDCYLAWARYYDCLAARSEAGDGRDCGAQPPDC